MKKINFIQKPPGFTLFEVVFVTALLVALFSIIILSFYSILKRDELSSSTQELLSIIKEAQVKTLSGTTVDNQNPSNFGVYFESQKYTLFEGQSFSPDNPNNNPPKDLPSSIVFSQINLPDSQIVFEKVTGQVRGFDENQNSLITKNNANNQIKTITINKFGIINVE